MFNRRIVITGDSHLYGSILGKGNIPTFPASFGLGKYDVVINTDPLREELEGRNQILSALTMAHTCIVVVSPESIHRIEEIKQKIKAHNPDLHMVAILHISGKRAELTKEERRGNSKVKYELMNAAEKEREEYLEKKVAEHKDKISIPFRAFSAEDEFSRLSEVILDVLEGKL
jgi:hypothetical protein